MGTEYGQFCAQPAKWIVVHTQPHREHVALENLHRQNFLGYCPVIRKRRSHGRRVTAVLRPFFPGYLFVKMMADSQRWQPLQSTIGVRSIVRCGDELSFIDDGFVQSLKAREIDGVICRPQSEYAVGQRIRFAAGALDGLVATIIEMREPDRLMVLMDLLNRSVKVTVDERDVAPL